jgi:2,4-dienoyl-CoA reductase-like NADH-dependent reductase (Old Yellow Enzyme family)
MADYYSQRASAGLIISEATGISQQGLGWPNAPGIWSDEQIAAWKPITKAVHDAGGRIVSQLWHMGRMVHPNFNGGELPVAASAIQPPDLAHTYEGRFPYPVPRPLEVAEVPGIIATYVHAARNAIAAGFDGVQIHGANGYLIDSFLRDGANTRTDEYGGSIENRIRLMREVTQAVADAVGKERTAIRLSPNGNSQGTDDSNPHPLYEAAAAALSDIGIAFIELREPGPDGTFGKPSHAPVHPVIRTAFKGPLVLNSDFTAEAAQAALDAGQADAIAFGRPFITSPDLPTRIARGLPFIPSGPAQWYGEGAAGYSDWPTIEEAA